MRNLQLSFHTTFPLKKSEVARVMGLDGSRQGFPDSVAGLMDRTGFGPKKVGPVKSWASRSGIIRGTELTAEGRTLLDVDPGLPHFRPGEDVDEHMSSLFKLPYVDAEQFVAENRLVLDDWRFAIRALSTDQLRDILGKDSLEDTKFKGSTRKVS